MTVEPTPPPSAPRERKAVARLAEALASAQAIARSDVDDVDELAPTPESDAPRPPDGTAESDPVEPDSSSFFDRVRSLPVATPANGDEDPNPQASRSLPVASDQSPAQGRSRGSGSFRMLYVLMFLLILAVPVLGFIGFRSVGESTRGQVLSGRSRPDAPGYEALVEPTPVAMLLQVDASGNAVSTTLLSLSGPDQKGGAVVSIPVGTRLKYPIYRLRTIGDVVRKASPEKAGAAIAKELGVGFTEVIKLDDTKLTSFIRPAGSLSIDNPVAVESPDGEQFAKGKLELSPIQVPQYLAADDAERSETTRVQRTQLVWDAWIAKIRAGKSRPGIVPGETTAGLGRYLRGLAAGDVSTASLPVVPAVPIEGHETFATDVGLSRLMLTNAVPFPVAGVAGDRTTAKVLNGTGPNAIPPSITQRLTYSGLQISVVGNAPRFDVERTTITYYRAKSRPFVMLVVAMLGNVKVVRAPAGEDTTDITIVIGKDLVANPPGALDPAEIGR